MCLLLLLSLITSTFVTINAMDSAVEKFHFHRIVEGISKGFNVNQAKEEMVSLRQQGDNPNKKDNHRTAAQLSSYYCIAQAAFFDEQLAILSELLRQDSYDEKKHNKEKILEELEEARLRINQSHTRLDHVPFNRRKIIGSGSYISEDSDDRIHLISKIVRINKVREVIEELGD
ncbi:MAG: hypothetical protein WCD44_04445 [Candidatus Babeliales bacterium]